MTMTQEDRQRFNHMEEKIDTLDNKVDKVLVLLGGDDLGHNEGLISEFKEFKKETRDRIKKLEEGKKKFINMAFGAGVVIAFVFPKLWEIIQSFIK